MAYYFMIEKKKGEYVPLDIARTKYFSGEPRYNKECACTLEEIDLFTMMFNNEKELRKSLVLEGALDIELVNKPLSTRNFNSGKYNKVPHDFLYQKDIEYVADPKKIIDYIMYRYYINDFVFIKKFADNFSNYYGCRITASDVRRIADESIRLGMWSKYINERDKNDDVLIKRLIKLLIYDHYEMRSGYIRYYDKINYRNLHAIIAFIRNYNKKNNKQENEVAASECLNSQEINEIMKELEYNKTYNEVNIKTKKRTKKKNTIDGQISFDGFN